MMEALAGIFGLFYGLLILVGLPYLFFSYLGIRDKNKALESRLHDLEKEIDQLRNESPQQTEHVPKPVETEIKSEAETVQAVSEPITAQAFSTYSSPDPITKDPERAPQHYVFNPENFDRLQNWLRTNWTLAIAALSLVLGGVFMVQYGVEKGLLTPPLRVIGALIVAAGLIGGGEFLRRRYGDQANDAMRHLPSTLAGAGVVVAFVAILSAHSLYDLIDALPALILLAILSILAVGMGWIYGPVLSAIGILGASAAPFLVKSDAESAVLLYPYFALIALIGLSIDSLKRWAWVSALALIAPSIGLALLWLADPNSLALAGAALVIGFGAIVIPEQSLTPTHSGPSILDQLMQRSQAHFTSLLAAGGIVIVALASMAITFTGELQADIWLGLAVLLILSAITIFWLLKAPALESLALVPAGLFLLWLALHALQKGPLFSLVHADPGLAAQGGPTSTIWVLAIFGALISLFGFVRMRLHLQANNGRPTFWAMGAAAFLPIVIFILEFLWGPSEVYGSNRWALGVIFAAALLIGFARHRIGFGDSNRLIDSGFFAAAALVLIALALFIVLTKTALTLALSVVIVLAALLDRRVPMPAMSWIIQLGIAVIAYRLVIDPGIDWSLQKASLINFSLAHLGPIAALIATLLIISKDSAVIRSVAESALVSFVAIFLTLSLSRFIGAEDFLNHWGFGVTATIWFCSALAQLWRLPHSTGVIRLIRFGFIGLFTISGAIMLMQLFDSLESMIHYGAETIIGPPIFDSLALAILPLAGLAAAGAKWLTTPDRQLPDWLRPGFAFASAGFVLLWGWLEIRRLWRGPDLSVTGPSDGELYSYTVAMLLISLGALAYAFIKRSDQLRKLAMIGVALTIAKVFLIDMSGLSGLVRVAAFLGLGLALTGLAWFNRVINENWSKD